MGRWVGFHRNPSVENFRPTLNDILIMKCHIQFVRKKTKTIIRAQCDISPTNNFNNILSQQNPNVDTGVHIYIPNSTTGCYWLEFWRTKAHGRTTFVFYQSYIMCPKFHHLIMTHTKYDAEKRNYQYTIFKHFSFSTKYGGCYKTIRS